MIRFNRKETQIHRDSKIVEFLEKDASFKIFVSSLGISFSGVSSFLTTQDDLEVLAEVIGTAWKEHQAMKGTDAQLQSEALEAPTGSDRKSSESS